MANWTVTTAQNIDELTNPCGTRATMAWTRVTTTATVTSTNHGLATGNLIYVTVSSDTGAIPLGSKSVTVTGANTFTFTCVNTGGAAGTLTYTGGDYITVNAGGTLTIDQDTRYGANASSTGAMNTITQSTSGGDIEVDARAVRLIPYNTGAGLVPAAGTVISKGGASGELIGVYSALNVAPTAAAAAMPATGYIKLKQVTGSFSSGALTGISASATGADVVGWIELLGIETMTITVNRLNLFRCRGDWFEVGTTDGVNTTTYQLPTNGNANFILPGVWVETGSSTGVYEFYPFHGSTTATAANLATTAGRGKACWISTAGLLRFNHDGTNNTGGYLPPSGRKIRIPNIILNNVTQAAQATIAAPTTTIANRVEFATTGGGALNLNYINSNWYINVLQAYSFTMTNSSFLTSMVLAEIASAMTVDNVGNGHEGTTTAVALTFNQCLAGGTVNNCVFTRYSRTSTTAYTVTAVDLANMAFTNNKYFAPTPRSAVAPGFNGTRVVSCTFTDETTCGGYIFANSTGITVTDPIYYDNPATTTTSTAAGNVVTFGSSCSDCVADGCTFIEDQMQPYQAVFGLSGSGYSNIKFRNLGTPASPLELGSAQADGTWTRATTTATVTATAHGLKTNDIINVLISSDTAAIVVGQKTITVTGANTFTFTCLNAGAASGTLTFYRVVTSNVLFVGGSPVGDDVRLQRLYTQHTRGPTVSCDNTNRNWLIEDVWGDYTRVPAPIVINMQAKKIAGAWAFAAATSQYGSSWVDAFYTNLMPSLSGLSWSRSSSTITVTLASHNLRTGDTVVVTTTSDASAVALGSRTVTVLTSSTFTITGTAAGSTSGTLTLAQCSGRLGILMNEETVDTPDLYVIDAGTPAFTSAGGVYMPNVNDQITWETPYYILGHTGFPVLESVMVGGGANTNFDVTYAIDINDGNGYSAFKNLSYPRSGASGSSGANTVTVTNATGVNVGDYCFGTNIAPYAKVTNVNTGTNTITLDTNNVGTVSGILRFNYLPNETYTASLGFKMKMRIKTTTANTTAITAYSVWTTTTSTSRGYQYALDTAVYTVTNLVAGSEVRAYTGTPGSSTEIGGTESSGTSFAFTHSSGGVSGYIIVHSLAYESLYIPVTFATTDQELLVQQQLDRNYENP